MLVIGLTGGIGSGKTTVANLFAELGIPHIDSDRLARQVVLPGTKALSAIIDRFGPHVLLENGELNRKALREIIFEAPQERQWLETLLHPLIRHEMQVELSQLNTPYALLVIPLLIGRPKHPLVQRILVVDSSSELQKQRVSMRDKIDPTQVDAIIAAQNSREELLKAADDVIENCGSLEDLKQQVLALHQRYLLLTQAQ